MTETSAPVEADRLARRQGALRNLWRVLGVASFSLLLAVSAFAFVQTQRVDVLRAVNASNKLADERDSITAANEYQALSTQFNNLFDACRKSVTCLASAPSQSAPVIIQGAPGQPGRSVSAADIQAALEGYCSLHNQCIGTSGAIGAAGAAGAAGQDGTNGATGAAGAAGTDGRGIASIACVLEADLVTTAFRFTFTDATTVDVKATCTPPPVAPVVSPAP